MTSKIMSIITSVDSKMIKSLKIHPSLLIPLFFGYGVLMIVIGFLLAFSMILLLKISTPFFQEDVLRTMLSMAFRMTFGLFSALIWLHYIYLALRSFIKSATVINRTSNVLKMVQLIAATAFAFSVIHYYVSLFSNSPAYTGIDSPAPAGGWSEEDSRIDRLCFIPDFKIIIDFLYFSTVTMATVGYGDIHPKTPLAKVITMIQIVFAFELIVVGLGSAMGQKDNEPE